MEIDYIRSTGFTFHTRNVESDNLPHRVWFLQNLVWLSVECDSCFCDICQWITRASETIEVIIRSTFGFSKHVHKLIHSDSRLQQYNPFFRQKGFYRCKREWLWNTQATMTNIIALNVICRTWLCVMFAYFQHGGHEPEVVISHHLWH